MIELRRSGHHGCGIVAALKIARSTAVVVHSLMEPLEKRRHLSASSAGAIDTAFGQHGAASIDVPGASYTNVTDVTVEPDGKIIIVGSAETVPAGSGIGLANPLAYGSSALLVGSPPIQFTQKIIVARLNPDGSPDTSFNGDGVVITDFNAPDAEATRVALDGNKIVVAGNANGNFALARYNADGSLDSTFGTGGKISLDLGHDDDKAWGLAVQSDGKIIAEGQSGGEVALVRFNADGTLDTTFGTGGKTLTPAPGATAATAADGSGPTLDGSGGVRILHGGKILVVSNETETDYSGRVDFLYFDSSGNLTALDQGAAQSSAPSIVDFTALANGKVITFSSDASALVQQYNSGATLDTAFGTSGTADSTLDWGGYGTVQSDGKILVAGSGSVGYNEGLGIARYNADGSIDTSFGNNGQVTSIAAGYSGAAVAIDPTGGIIGVASSYDASGNPTVSAARFLPNVGISIPTATLTSAPTLTHSGNNQAIVSITYSSAVGIDPNSLQDGNLTVTKTGSDGSNDLPTYYLDQTTNADGSITVRYQIQKDYAGHNFDALDNGSYTISLTVGSVYDYNGTPVSAPSLGKFLINIAAPPGGIQFPTAKLDPVSITDLNVTDATISVTFNSSIGLDANSLGGGITVTGPNGFNQYAYYQDYKVNADGSVTATFSLQHDDAHQAFTSADNGTYTVAIDDAAVLDLDGNPLAGSTIGTFKVNVPAVPAGLTPPTATFHASDLTDANATSETLTVTYNGPAAIATNTLDGYDLVVTGPNNYSQTANFQSSTVNPDGSTTATYSLSVGYGGIVPLAAGTTVGAVKPAIGTSAIIGNLPISWGGGLSNGLYTVAIAANQVNDVRGVSVAPATLGTFNVNLPQRATPYPAPVYLDTVGSAAQAPTDPHHANSTAALSNTSLGGVAAKNAPVRTHVGIKHKKHHHKHKKH